MAGIEANDFSTPDELRSPERTTVEIVKIANGEIGRYTFQPGWRWSDCIKPLVGTDTCQVEHIGYVISGTLRVDHEDGTTLEIPAGSVYRIGPGHDGSVVGEEPAVVVEFQGAATYAKA
jgi:hypothetical protein